MSIKFQLILIIAASLSMFFLTRKVLQAKIKLNYAIVWFVGMLFILGCALFPDAFYRFSDWAGVGMPVNFMFLITIFFLYCLCFYLFQVISEQSIKIVNLTYKVAELAKRLEEGENNE